MNYSLIDSGGMCLAVLAYVLLLVGPGLAIGEIFAPFGFRQVRGAERFGVAAMLALAVLPVLDTLAVKAMGLSLALGLHLALAVLGVILALKRRERLSFPPLVILALAVWLLLVLLEWIEFDIGGGLYLPYTVIDTVKHAATTQAIHDSGVAPTDPFFARQARVGYYYYFYTLSALCQQLGAGLISARMAVGGLAVWTGVGAFTLCRTVLGRSGLVDGQGVGRTARLLLVVMLVGGLDILMVMHLGLVEREWLPDPVWWNEQITGWVESLIWVPHHIAGLIAAVCGLMSLADEDPGADKTSGVARRIALAALCFASALGLSVWITFGAVATMAAWLFLLMFERRWARGRDLVLTGLLTLVFALPFLLELKAGRAPSQGPAVSLTVRMFSPLGAPPHPSAVQYLLRLLCLPLNYFLEFGLLFAGARVFWSRRRTLPRGTELARVLTVSAVAGLFIGSFLKSNLYNNDLGWRIMLYPILAGTVWTVAAWTSTGASPTSSGRAFDRFPSRATWLLVALGGATTAYGLISLRAYHFWSTPEALRAINRDPATDRDLRTAFLWANVHLSSRAVLQQNPFKPRVFAFGLYGHNPTAVGDAYAGLYGADQTSVTKRLNEAFPIFEANSPTKDVYDHARRMGVGDLIVTADDPAWTAHADWVWRSQPVFATPRVRIIPVAALEGGP